MADFASPLPSQRFIIGFLASLTVLLAFGIDTALPAFDEIRDEYSLASGSGEVSLIVTVYLLGLACGQPFYGPITDRFGRRPVVLASLAIYIVGALGSSLAPSFSWLLVSRLIWGIGAAGPHVVATAIARDLYDGDEMARVLSLVTAVFLIGPTIAPLIGASLLLTGVWQTVFLVQVALAGLVAIRAWRFPETHPPDKRRSINLRSVASGYRLVFTNRTSAGYIAVMVFSFGAFFVFLGSSQPIVDEIYGRPEWFAFTFAGIAAVNGMCIFASSRIVHRVGAATLAARANIGLTAAYVVFLVLALGWGGVPPFGVWVLLVTVTGTLSTLISITGISLALQPMARLAGTAAAARGLATLGGGALLAALVDRQISDTVTPMAVGGVIYGALGLACLWWARGGTLDPVSPT